MKRLNTTYFEPFKMDGNDEFDPTDCIDCGHGVWAYGAEYGNRRLMYVFSCPDAYGESGHDCAHWDSVFTYMQGLAIELQKDVGGYVAWCDYPEALVFMVMNEKAFDDITDGWWYDDEDNVDWWHGLKLDEIRVRCNELNVEEFDANKKNLLKLGEE